MIIFMVMKLLRWNTGKILLSITILRFNQFNLVKINNIMILTLIIVNLNIRTKLYVGFEFTV